MVVALEYHDPLFDPHAAFQKFKTHPYVRKILEGGKLVRYGAKTVPYGGWYSMPKSFIDGGLIIGDSASLLNSQRLKGIHTAIKSGMLAAEAIYEALCAGDTSAATGCLPAETRAELDEKRIVGRAKFPPGISRWLMSGLGSSRIAVRHRRTRPDGSNAFQARPKKYQKLNRERLPVDQATRFKGDEKSRLTVSPTSIIPARAMKKTNLSPHRSRSQHLRGPLCPRIRKPLPVFLPGSRLRNYRRGWCDEAEDQFRQLRPLQNVRHRRSLSDYRLGYAGRRRRPQLRRHVNRARSQLALCLLRD